MNSTQTVDKKALPLMACFSHFETAPSFSRKGALTHHPLRGQWYPSLRSGTCALRGGYASCGKRQVRPACVCCGTRISFAKRNKTMEVTGLAIYHMESKIVSRGTGRSVVAASAYMSCSRLYNDYDGVQHDYTKKQGLVWQQVFLPP